MTPRKRPPISPLATLCPLLLLAALPGAPARADEAACVLNLYVPDCRSADPEAFPQDSRPQVTAQCYGEPFGPEQLSVLDAQGEEVYAFFEPEAFDCDGVPALTLETTLPLGRYTVLTEEHASQGGFGVIAFEVVQPRVATSIIGGCGCAGAGGSSPGAAALGLLALLALALRPSLSGDRR